MPRFFPMPSKPTYRSRSWPLSAPEITPLEFEAAPAGYFCRFAGPLCRPPLRRPELKIISGYAVAEDGCEADLGASSHVAYSVRMLSESERKAPAVVAFGRG